jgi:hypothetical protein
MRHANIGGTDGGSGPNQVGPAMARSGPEAAAEMMRPQARTPCHGAWKAFHAPGSGSSGGPELVQSGPPGHPGQPL